MINDFAYEIFSAMNVVHNEKNVVLGISHRFSKKYTGSKCTKLKKNNLKTARRLNWNNSIAQT